MLIPAWSATPWCQRCMAHCRTWAGFKSSAMPGGGLGRGPSHPTNPSFPPACLRTSQPAAARPGRPARLSASIMHLPALGHILPLGIGHQLTLRPVQAVAEGPRATPAFCATAARLMAALAASAASLPAGARFCAAVGEALQAAEDKLDALGGRNLALLLGQLCLAGLLGSDVVYSALDHLLARCALRV